MTTNFPQLFSPTEIGPVALKHRVVMAPLTRLRAEVPGDRPTAAMAEYYGQRASEGGLIISEATAVSNKGSGYLYGPGIYSDDQIAGWKRVTEAVHAKGGVIFMQLWHSGRVSHYDLAGSDAPVGPSAVPFEGMVYTKDGWVAASPTRAAETSEVPSFVEQFKAAAVRAREAGFDGVELHAANGYLLDQFLQDGSNKREDAYGGTKEKRARLLFDTIQAVASVWSHDRIGVRLSPSGTFLSMSDSKPEVTFDYLATELNKLGLAYLHLIEPRVAGSDVVAGDQGPVAAERLSKLFKGPIIAAGGFEPDSAEAIIKAGHASLVAFGRHFISNPDLPKRIQHGLPLTAYDRGTFYTHDNVGYTDYAFVS